MRRVLVIQDVGLWIDLNRHLSGVASVDLVEAVSFETGQLLAQIERPRIVICGADSDGPGAAALAREFSAGGLKEIQVIAVDRSASSTTTYTTRHVPGQPIVCAAERLFDLVSELLELEREELAPRIELLAHYELKDDRGELVRGFAVILELSERSIAFESDIPLEGGSELHMNFFLSDPMTEAQRLKVSLSCIVAQCRDEAKLVYGARVTKLGDAARKAVQRHAMLGEGEAA